MSGLPVRDVKASCIAEEEIILPHGIGRNLEPGRVRAKPYAAFQTVERFHIRFARHLVLDNRIEVGGLRGATAPRGAREERDIILRQIGQAQLWREGEKVIDSIRRTDEAPGLARRGQRDIIIVGILPPCAQIEAQAIPLKTLLGVGGEHHCLDFVIKMQTLNKGEARRVFLKLVQEAVRPFAIKPDRPVIPNERRLKTEGRVAIFLQSLPGHKMTEEAKFRPSRIGR